MREKTSGSDQLPNLRPHGERGAVTYRQEYRRCGKKTCSRCAPGQPGHGPYWYATWWEKGRQRTRYVGKELPPDVDAARATASVSPLQVQTLGGFAVHRGESLLTWPSRRAAALFKCLLSAHGHRVTREQAIELLWPEADPELAAASLRTTIYLLRQTVDAVGSGTHLRTEGGVLMLLPGASLTSGGAWLDAEEFERLAGDALAREDSAACRRALDAYTGEYLPDDPYEPWTEPIRGRLERLRISLQLHLAQLTAGEGELAEAEICLRRVLDTDATHEEAAGALMSLLAASGRGHEALRMYHTLAARLEEDLGVAPSADIEALRAQIIAQRASLSPLSASAPAKLRTSTNLPMALTSFVGRQWELTETRDLVGDSGLVTLTGPGGCGKTRLALEVAETLVDGYADGVWLVELAGVADPALVPSVVAGALGVEEQASTPLIETLLHAWGQREMVLVLDNCEHVIGACAELVGALLSGCPRLRLLATSREAVGVAGEVNYRVPSLAAPDPERPAPLQTLAGYEAVALFVERARAQRPGFSLTPGNAPAVMQICARLDGLPLAIELAAARLSVLPAGGIAQRLDDRFRLLAGGPRTALPRQQTLRATMDWSHSLLTRKEQIFFRRLAVFAGGWTLEAAEAVCSGNELSPADILDLLDGLVHKSLVIQEACDGEARYRMLETIREYAGEKLIESGEAGALGAKHLNHCLDLATQAAPGLTGPEHRSWLESLERERANLRRALRWARDEGLAREGILLLANAIPLWEEHGPLGEARQWLEQFIALGDGTALREDRILHADALRRLGRLCGLEGDEEAAQTHLEHALSLAADEGDAIATAKILNNLAAVAHSFGSYERAMDMYRQALPIATKADDRWHMAAILTNMGNVAADMGERDQAISWLHEALSILEELGDRRVIGMNLNVLGEIYRADGDISGARTAFSEALRLLHDVDDRVNLAYSFDCLARVARDQRDFRRAAVLLGAADSIRLPVGLGGHLDERMLADEVIADCERAVGEPTVAAARQEGTQMSIAEAVAFALGVQLDEPVPPERAPVSEG